MKPTGTKSGRLTLTPMVKLVLRAFWHTYHTSDIHTRFVAGSLLSFEFKKKKNKGRFSVNGGNNVHKY